VWLLSIIIEKFVIDKYSPSEGPNHSTHKGAYDQRGAVAMVFVVFVSAYLGWLKFGRFVLAVDPHQEEEGHKDPE
jgi:hypothetical protein